MNITIDVVNAVDEIMSLKPKIVGIDGIDGVGKTLLAKKLEELSYKRISLDDYLQRESGEYFKFINFDSLKNNIEKASNSTCVIEGVLLLKIIEKLDVRLDYLIYISDRVWIYDWIEDYGGKYFGKDLDEIIQEVENSVNRVQIITNPEAQAYNMKGLRREIYEYSHKYKPWEQANTLLVQH